MTRGEWASEASFRLGSCLRLGPAIEIDQKLLRFRADKPVAVGALVEITIPWSIQLDGKIRLKLIVKGRVVHSVEGEMTVKVGKQEFHTRASNSVPASTNGKVSTI